MSHIMPPNIRQVPSTEGHYLFIDGGCLRVTLEKVSDRYMGGSPVRFNYEMLAQEFSKVFYYDAVQPKRGDESDEEYEQRVEIQEASFNALRAIDGFHVYEGITQRRRKVLQQKKVDIMIAVDMLTYSFRRVMHTATLLTSDLDFKPLIDALVQDGMYVTLWHPSRTTNHELIFAADATRVLDIDNLWGYIINRPAGRLPAVRRNHDYNMPYHLIATYHNSNDVELKLHHNQGEYTFVFPSEMPPPSYIPNSKYFTYVSHNDLDFLKKYIEDKFFDVDWDATN